MVRKQSRQAPSPGAHGDGRLDLRRFSVVVPLYNEEDVLPELGRRLTRQLDALEAEAEVILVDDGSHDGTYEAMSRIAESDPRFKLVRLSRNFGHQIAITAGIDSASGDAVVIMDGDLQHPPELIPDLVAKWREGYDVVYAIRADRAGDPRLKRTGAKLFYRALDRLVDVDVPANAGDFRLVDRRALDAFRAMRETNRYVRGMFSWVGFRQTGIPYRYEARHGGRTKYTLRRMVELAANALTSFSSAPLRLALHLGFAVASLSFAAGIAAVVVKLAGVSAVPGWASLVFVTSFLGGVQLFILGVVGVYIGRVYEEVKNRPLYVVQEAHGFENPRARVATRTAVATRRDDAP